MKNTVKNQPLKFVLIAMVLSIAALACRVSAPTTEPGSSSVLPTALPTIIAPAAVVQPIPQVIEDEQNLLIELYKRVNPSVVNITIYASQQGDLVGLGQGSGFLIDQNGDFVTNAHVVQGGEQIEVSFSDGTIRPATLVGEDPHSDLAVINVQNLPAGVQPLPLGNMDEVQVGQTVVAIGNPFGLDGTLTRGIVSAIGRTIPALTSFSIPKAIQTDAPINPGNSGGPLLNLMGEVIGVNAQIETDGSSSTNSGVGFAIPVSILQRVAPELIQNGKYDWAWLGVRGTSLNPYTSKAMELPVEKGAYISDIVADGPASKTDLRGSTSTQTVDGREVFVGGDVITAIDGTPVTSFDDLLIYIALQTKPNQEVILTVWRDGQMLEIPLTLEARPISIQTEPSFEILPTPSNP